MSRWIKWLLLVNLAVIAVLVFAYPELMVSPGKVQTAHAAIGNDCFACHLPLRGAAADKCTACHRPADIGRLTTTGLPIVDSTPIHQALTRQDCMACHREHADRLTPAAGTVARFDHAMLGAPQARDCRSCHKAPDTRVHRGVTLQCSQCHGTQAWEPATFDHGHLDTAQLAACSNCHRTPTDRLHASFGNTSCGQCHGTKAWEPAQFDHDRYFPLVGDHRASCATCHPRNDTARYSCYGCHEHTPANIREEHLEEGIRDFQDCVECHGPRARFHGEGRSRGGEEED